MYHFDWTVFWHYLWPVTALSNPLIRGGLISTILVSVIAQVMGVILGLFAALGKTSESTPIALVGRRLCLVFSRYTFTRTDGSVVLWPGRHPHL